MQTFCEQCKHLKVVSCGSNDCFSRYECNAVKKRSAYHPVYGKGEWIRSECEDINDGNCKYFEYSGIRHLINWILGLTKPR